MNARFALVLFFFAGCSGGGDLPVTPKDLAAAPPDLTVPIDFSVPPDLTKIPPDLAKAGPTDANGVGCGNMTCPFGDVCCATLSGMMASFKCAKSCDADGGAVAITCDGPEDCPGGNPCCAKFGVRGGGAGGMVSCGAKPTDCEPFLDLQAMAADTRLCHVNADCTRDAPNTQLNQCCSVMQQGVKIDACLNAMIGGLIGAVCQP